MSRSSKAAQYSSVGEGKAAMEVTGLPVLKRNGDCGEMPLSGI